MRGPDAEVRDCFWASKSLPTRQVANTGRSPETPWLGEADSARWALEGTRRHTMGPAAPSTQLTAKE